MGNDERTPDGVAPGGVDANGKWRTEDSAKRTPASVSGGEAVFVYWLPFPKGLPTAVELIPADTADFESKRAIVRRGIESFANRETGLAWPEHPAFGTLSAKEWGVLGYRHTDHHLRQFGV